MALPPKRVLITGAAGQIAYSLIFNVAKGQMLGSSQPVIIHLFDIPGTEQALQGVVMEIDDCAFPLVKGTVPTTKIEEAFANVDVALLVGAMPRRQGMERADLLKANVAIFKEQGAALDKYASRDVKVCVVGNPANTNALVAALCAPSIPRENFTALTRLDHNRARTQIAQRAGVSIDDVQNVVIWGNHSATQYPDVSHGTVRTSADTVVSVEAAVNNTEWLQTEFVKVVQQRGAAVIAARKLSSAASAAKAITDHVHDWVLGTAPGQFVSMAVPSDGSYGIAPGVIYSFPVTCANGKYTIVQGLSVSAFSRSMMDATDRELRDEFKTAAEFLGL
eukprot:TRINITY_DN18901_c0_g1_i1.p1 TRINITY_DN18901_c0_g1~~TRINITY_DN18901_c0_g1_i1.p1  ORF type:complete len:335 (-),score=89.12 TRINITY_DN18901_c0_g1_i1:66-1070(-)